MLISGVQPSYKYSIMAILYMMMFMVIYIFMPKTVVECTRSNDEKPIEIPDATDEQPKQKSSIQIAGTIKWPRMIF